MLQFVTFSDIKCFTVQHNKFMKRVCRNSTYVRYKCLNSDQSYGINEDIVQDSSRGILTVTMICSSPSPVFYQACGLKSDFKLYDGDISNPCGYICKGNVKDEKVNYFLRSDNPAISAFIQKTNLCNIRISEFLKLNMSLKDFGGKCDGYCVGIRGYKLCEDESFCNGYNYGINCDGNSLYVSNVKLCDGKQDCYDGMDETICSTINETYQTCNRHNEIVPLYDFNRCGPIILMKLIPIVHLLKIPYCKNYMDQTNCSDPDRIGIHCKINGFMSTVSKSMICNTQLDIEKSFCDDGLDIICVTPSISCKIHKHQICDRIPNCIEETDENDCSEMTVRGCERNFQTGRIIPIPFTWIKDGVVDCIDGIDETFAWPTCGFNKTQRYVSIKQNFSCPEVYLCQDGFVELHKLCDRLDSCGNENKICEHSRRQIKTFTTPMKVGNKNALLKCLPGMKELYHVHNIAGRCVSTLFEYPNYPIFGLDKFDELLTPTLPSDCKYTFGKIFVYLSCLGLCKNSSCPLKMSLRHNSCVGQYQDRIFTVANNSYLTFVLRRDIGGIRTYRSNLFPCRNKRCVTYEKVCDLVDDCGDQSDEMTCSNNFQCKSSKTFLPWSMVCDGIIDCMDFSDECNVDCGKQIISTQSMRYISWMIGILATGLNAVSLSKHVYNLTQCKVARSMFNVICLMLINLGDLLVALYLQIVIVFDILYKDSYCGMQLTWLTSRLCSFVGVLSTFGTCISVLSMTILSVNRFLVMKSGMVASPEITKKHVNKYFFITLLVIVISFAISIVPLVSFFEDFFVNGVVYSSNNPLLLGSIKKAKLFEILRAYYGRIQSKTLSWNMMESLVSDIFSKDYTVVMPRKLQFYGNDAVCLFKYFVTSEDPQWIYVWTVLTFHWFSLLVIIFSYIGIWNETKNSSAHLITSTQNDHVKQRNNAMQRKIMIIIGTDSLIWIPFLIICFLHTAEVIDATSWYSIFSMIIIPLNTVINPLILNDSVKRAALSVMSQVLEGTATVRELVRNFMSIAIENPNANDIEIPRVTEFNEAENDDADIKTNS